MPKMEFELTKEQIEKIKILEGKGIGVGDAIDQLFIIKDEAMKQLERVERGVDIVEQLTNSSMDADEKIEVVKERYAEAGKTPDVAIQEVKERVSWGRDFFKF